MFKILGEIGVFPRLNKKKISGESYKYEICLTTNIRALIYWSYDTIVVYSLLNKLSQLVSSQ